MTSQVLLNLELPWRSTIDTSGRFGATRDGSALPFLLEQLVAFPTTGVQIPAASIAAEYAPTLPTLFRKRLRVIDTRDILGARTSSLLAPVFRDFGINWQDGAIRCPNPPPWLSTNEHDLCIAATFVLREELHLLLLAMSRRAAVQIDLPALRKALETLRAYAREPSSRAILANLAGLTAAYQPSRVGAVRFSPSVPDGLQDAFEELVQSTLYMEATRATYLMGLPPRAKRAAYDLRRIVTDLVRRPAFQALLSLGLKTVSLVTGASVPDLPVRSPGRESFLPPIVTFRSELARGISYWKDLEPDFLPPRHSAARRIVPWAIDKEIRGRSNWYELMAPNPRRQQFIHDILDRAPNPSLQRTTPGHSPVCCR